MSEREGYGREYGIDQSILQLTNSRMTIQQNFSWVDECMQRENRKPGDNASPALPLSLSVSLVVSLS